MTLAGQTENWSVFFEGDPRHESLEHMTPGSRGHALHAELDVRQLRISSSTRRGSAPSCPGASTLDAVLRAQGIDTVVIVGTLSNVCCESSARDAMMLNYRPVFVVGRQRRAHRCRTQRDAQQHRASLRRCARD